MTELVLYQVEMSLEGYEEEIRKIFPLPMLKDSFTSHISQALKKQRKGENLSGITYVPCGMPSPFEMQGQ